jgi:hypothetical protein
MTYRELFSIAVMVGGFGRDLDMVINNAETMCDKLGVGKNELVVFHTCEIDGQVCARCEGRGADKEPENEMSDLR